MKKIKLINLILSIFICFLTSGAIVGSLLLAKEANDIVYVRNKNDLNKIRNNLAGHYVFDVDGYVQIDEPWVPIGSEEHPFTGRIEGNGHGINIKKGFLVDNDSNDVGLFAYNKGTIQHLKIMVYGQVLNFNSNEVNNYNLNLGMLCGSNGGYVTGCEINFSKLNIPEKIETLNCGGVAGINYGQIQECSIASGTNLEIFSNTNFGFFVGKSCGDSVIKYCWRSNYFGVYSKGQNNNIGYCCGYCESGCFENISISIPNSNSNLSVDLRLITENDCEVVVGGLIGKINAVQDIAINNIALNISYNTNAVFGYFSFISPKINTNNHNIKLSNIWCSGKVTFPLNNRMSGNVIYFYSDNNSLITFNNIYRSDIACSENFILGQGIYKKFEDINLSDLSFDEAVWEKGKYSFYLNYVKKN